MLKEKFSQVIKNLIDEVDTKQKDAIEKAADLIVESVRNKGAIHLYDTGHIINSELINRAGGLALLKPLRYTFTVDDPVFPREQKNSGNLEGLGKLILDKSNVLPGDVMILGSVSGKSPNVIELALAAREKGVKLIVVTSVVYSSSVKSEHSSGKHLYELGDVVIDNGAPIGDAAIQVEGLSNPFGAVSGIGAAYALWLVSAEIVEKMLALGMEPAVYLSINKPEGRENHKKMVSRYEENGY
ncbi:MAG: sugar isomerase domain-containing protein [Ruminococcaceae bacterium]|nr:sugar isomerase domain-containing protein [Oscillospiraceae bacterium]